MQLTSLEIHGFKSFAERTKFVFDAGITGIVGPNGCGKSNVVDSIRWVLGEQRTKNLRSDKMESVIFNGTAHRRKANIAEVSLTFENTKNILPTEYTTVTITRKLYRTGDSEYLINGVVCRLRDIHNLFMDTGIASDSYSIIELKMVDEILTNKDQERRRFFEEAAGISKYKVRKKQTLKQLDEVDADLMRVEDLLAEIDKNLRSLEKQAKRTQKYFELKAEYKTVSSRYAYLKMADITRRIEEMKARETRLHDEALALQTQQTQREVRLAELKKTIVDQEQALTASQQALNAHIRRIQEVESQKSIKNERLKYLQQREIAINNQTETERRQLDTLNTQVASLTKQLAEAEANLTQQKAKKETLEREVAALRERNTALQAQAEAVAGEHRDLDSEGQRVRQEIEIKGVQLKSIVAELERAQADRDERTEDLDAFAEKAQSLAAETAALEKQVNELRAAAEQHRNDLAEAEQRVTTYKDNVYKTNRLLDARNNEHALTKSLVESLEGFPESVKFLKKNAKWMKDAPLLSDIFSAKEEYKVPLENYLEPYLSYYIVPDREDAIQSVKLLSDAAKGRANFFIMSELSQYKPRNPLLFTQATHALDVVTVVPEYQKLAAYLLDNVYLVARETDIPDSVPEGAVMLTQTGGLMRRPFVLAGGSLGLFEGKRLGRAKNLEKLNDEIGKLGKQLASEKQLLAEAETRLKALKTEDFASRLAPVERDLIGKQRDLALLQTREREHREFIARVGARAEALVREQESLQQAIATLTPRQATLQEELLRLSSRLMQARMDASDAAMAYTDQSRLFNEENIRLIQLQNLSDNFRRDLDARATQIETLAANADKLKAERVQTGADIDAIIESNHQDDDTIVGLYEEKRALEGKTSHNEELLGQTKSAITQQEQSINDLRQQREDIRTRQDDLTRQLNEINLSSASLKERMSVEFSIELDGLSKVALFGDEPEDELDVTDEERRLIKLRDQVQNYGEINPLAMEAYEEMRNRYDFINTQRNDLIEAKDSLLETISEIDTEAKEKFMATYDAVRTNFQQVFRSLFNAEDTCDLVLTEPENPLESEIEIVARPKGKRPISIAQLSGGEKTLTAVALLFSIYLIKPAPFCVFDEVDAPLDDANIDKFNNIIRDFSKDSQFLIVTHNKRTMASTNVMYGVTMEADGNNAGISRVLPVDLAALNLV